MGWIRVIFEDGSTPEWAAELNAEADRLDPLSYKPDRAHRITGYVNGQPLYASIEDLDGL